MEGHCTFHVCCNTCPILEHMPLSLLFHGISAPGLPNTPELRQPGSALVLLKALQRRLSYCLSALLNLGLVPQLSYMPTHASLRRAPQVLDSFAEDADTVFGIPEESLLEVGLPYRL
jgi:hypothetical protein